MKKTFFFFSFLKPVFDAVSFLKKDMIPTYEYNPKKVGFIIAVLKKLGFRMRPRLILSETPKTKNELDELKEEIKELRQLLISTRDSFTQDLLREVRKEIALLKGDQQ